MATFILQTGLSVVVTEKKIYVSPLSVNTTLALGDQIFIYM